MHGTGYVVTLSWLGGGVGFAQGETQLCGSREALSCSVRIAEGFGGGDDEQRGCGSQSGLLTAMGFKNSWCPAQCAVAAVRDPTAAPGTGLVLGAHCCG